MERIVRALHKPILTVTDRFREPKAHNDCLRWRSRDAAWRGDGDRSPLFAGLPIFPLMSGRTTSEGPRQIEWARNTLSSAGIDVTAALQPGDAETATARAVKERVSRS